MSGNRQTLYRSAWTRDILLGVNALLAPKFVPPDLKRALNAWAVSVKPVQLQAASSQLLLAQRHVGTFLSDPDRSISDVGQCVGSRREALKAIEA